MLNVSPDCDTNDVFGELLTTHSYYVLHALLTHVLGVKYRHFFFYLLPIFCQVEKNYGVANGLHQRGWLGHMSRGRLGHHSNLPHHVICQ